jgi:hypothetical protein
VLVLAIGHELGPQDAIRIQQAVTAAVARTVLVLAIGHELGPGDAVRVQQAVSAALAHPGAQLVPVPAGIRGSFAVLDADTGRTELHHDDLPGAVAALAAALVIPGCGHTRLECLPEISQKDET